MEIVESTVKGDRRAAARLISMIEDRDTAATEALSLLHRYAGKAHVVGVTGPPGAGKSTLVDRLAKEYRKINKKVGIIAVDPSSPFTGGAILGDRIRMSDLNTDPGVFIRSMGTRGHLGGIARATGDAIKVLDAMGMDVIIVETVGAGQSEVDIVSHAHTTILVEMPGLGDDIQTIKAGIMEIGDIFVVNKADRHGAEMTVAELQAMLDLNPEKPDWTPPVMSAVASEGKGIRELLETVEVHRRHLKESGRMERLNTERIRHEFLEILRDMVTQELLRDVIGAAGFEERMRGILARETDPYTAARACLEDYKGAPDR